MKTGFFKKQKISCLDQFGSILNLKVISYFDIVLQMNPTKPKTKFHTLRTNPTQNDLNLFMGDQPDPKFGRALI